MGILRPTYAQSAPPGRPARGPRAVWLEMEEAVPRPVRLLLSLTCFLLLAGLIAWQPWH